MRKRRENRTHIEFKKPKKKPFPTPSKSGNMALINNKWVKYNACGDESKEECENFYEKGFKYIGSTKTLSHSGVINRYQETYHCFISNKKSTQGFTVNR